MLHGESVAWRVVYEAYFMFVDDQGLRALNFCKIEFVILLTSHFRQYKIPTRMIRAETHFYYRNKIAWFQLTRHIIKAIKAIYLILTNYVTHRMQ